MHIRGVSEVWEVGWVVMHDSRLMIQRTPHCLHDRILCFFIPHSSSFIQGFTFLSIDPCIGIPDIFYNRQLGVMFSVFPPARLSVRLHVVVRLLVPLDRFGA